MTTRTHQDEQSDTECSCYQIDIENIHDDADVDTEDRASERNGEDHKSHRYCDRPSAPLSPVFRVAWIVGAVKVYEKRIWKRLASVGCPISFLNIWY